MEPLTLTNLTKEKRNKISEGLMLIIETELDIMSESCPAPYQVNSLYIFDTLIKIAYERKYLDKDFVEKYCKKRNELMNRYSQAEDPHVSFDNDPEL